MKQLLRNHSEYRNKLNQGSQKISTYDHSFFCVVLGYMLNKIPDFDLLYKILEDAFGLFAEGKLLEAHFSQWLLFLEENPFRFDQCVHFLDNIKNQDGINVSEELDNLIKSDQYFKRPLRQKNKHNSFDTVVLENDRQNQSFQQMQKVQKRQESYSYFQDEEKKQFKQSLNPEKSYESDQEFDSSMWRNMLQDEAIARKLQQQEQQMMKQYREKNEETTCEICCVGLFQEGEAFFLDKCRHGFHKECIQESFKFQIKDNNFPLKCPDENCKAECYDADIKDILTKEMFAKYQDHALKAYAETHGDSVCWCPTADCGYLFFFDKGDTQFHCPECKKQYCLNCRCDWHKGMTCAEYKVSNTETEADKQFLEFVAGKKFKQCPKCKFWVEKNQGCDHMTCKCKFEFCYKCGGVYMKCDCFKKQQQEAQRRMAQIAAQREQMQRKKEESKKKREAERKARAEAKAKQKQEKQKQKDDEKRRGRSKNK